MWPASVSRCGPQSANHQSVLNKIVRRNIAVLSTAVCAVEVWSCGGATGRTGTGVRTGSARCGATVGVGAGCGAACAPVRVAGVRRAAAVGGLGLHLSRSGRCGGGLRIRVRLGLDARVHAVDGCGTPRLVGVGQGSHRGPLPRAGAVKRPPLQAAFPRQDRKSVV